MHGRVIRSDHGSSHKGSSHTPRRRAGPLNASRTLSATGAGAVGTGPGEISREQQFLAAERLVAKSGGRINIGEALAQITDAVLARKAGGASVEAPVRVRRTVARRKRREDRAAGV